MTRRPFVLSCLAALTAPLAALWPKRETHLPAFGGGEVGTAEWIQIPIADACEVCGAPSPTALILPADGAPSWKCDRCRNWSPADTEALTRRAEAAEADWQAVEENTAAPRALLAEARTWLPLPAECIDPITHRDLSFDIHCRIDRALGA